MLAGTLRALEDIKMKQALLLLLSSAVLISCRDLGGTPPIEPEIAPPTVTEYYWAGGSKIELTMNRKTVIGVYKPDSARSNRTLEIIYFSKYQLSPLRDIVASKGFDPDQFEWLSFGYLYQGGEVLPTNRIAFELLPGYTRYSLDSLIVKKAIFDSTKFGSAMLKVIEQEGNVFRIADDIQESGIVRYSCPDFVIRITFGDKGAG
jgi:hypothetical protein